MAAAAASFSSSSTALIPPPLPEGDGDDAPNWVLLDIDGYMGDYSNATSAESHTSTGKRIQVSFFTARPPQVSHFCVFCPDLGPGGFRAPPKVVAVDSDLILFRVSLFHQKWSTPHGRDYFLYRAHPRNPSLHLVPHPYPNNFKDKDVALLSLGGDEYAVAALRTRYRTEEGVTTPNTEFNLYLYRSSKPLDGWTSKVVSVAEPLRDKVCPLDFLPYHATTKVIILGRGMVGWVDLWRGILLCNVLQENRPDLVDIPLPPPARGNWKLLLQCHPYVVRDITVSLLKDSIKCIEIENFERKLVDADSSRAIAWKATTWSLPIPIVPSQAWHPDCTFDVADITIDPMHSGPLPSLRTTDDNPSKPILPAHLIGIPTMSMDGEFFYLLHKACHTPQTDAVIALDMRNKTLQGFADLVTGKDFTLTRCCTSEISKYLCKDKGTR